mmetsp:Transcript_17747/g.37056  ORF Transcript_17747/g.37056 Transcript_17747/m.37056 type:complete len:157 (-) Transcript_17747:66-536(-)
MYQGPRQTINDFFESYGHPVPRHYNPADHFIEVLFKIPDVDADGLSEMHGDTNAHEMWSKCFRQWRKEEIETSVTHQSQPNWIKRKTYVVRNDPVDRKRDKVKRAAKKKHQNRNRTDSSILRRSAPKSHRARSPTGHLRWNVAHDRDSILRFGKQT